MSKKKKTTPEQRARQAEHRNRERLAREIREVIIGTFENDAFHAYKTGPVTLQEEEALNREEKIARRRLAEWVDHLSPDEVRKHLKEDFRAQAEQFL